MKTLGIILGVVLLSAQLARAGGVGNGGFVLDCKEDGKWKTVVYDYVDAKRRADNLAKERGQAQSDYKLDMGDENAPWREQVAVVLNRLAKYDGTRFRLYMSWGSTFMSESEEVSKLAPTIADTGVAPIPVNCKNLRLAVGQRDESQLFPGDKRYSRVKEVWDGLPERTKAGIVLHEISYREGISFNHQSSAPARYYNSFISSNQLARISSIKEYEDLILRAGYRIISIGPTALKNIRYEGSTIAAADVDGYNDAIINNQLAKVDGGKYHIQHMPETGGTRLYYSNVIGSISVQTNLGVLYCYGGIHVQAEEIICGRGEKTNLLPYIIDEKGQRQNLEWITVNSGRVISVGGTYYGGRFTIKVNAETYLADDFSSDSSGMKVLGFSQHTLQMNLYGHNLRIYRLFFGRNEMIMGIRLQGSQDFPGKSGVNFLEDRNDGVCAYSGGSTGDLLDRTLSKVLKQNACELPKFSLL